MKRAPEQQACPAASGVEVDVRQQAGPSMPFGEPETIAPITPGDRPDHGDGRAALCTAPSGTRLARRAGMSVHHDQPSLMLADAEGAARRARLRYVYREEPGIRRIKKGRAFRYERSGGSKVTDNRTLRRIRALAIPPAWKDVWICAEENGHLQATGTDARGRRQYRYHARWREVRDEAKYHDVVSFARTLPKLRGRVRKDLSRSRLSKKKVLATVVGVMERTCIRVGNERYAR